MMVKLKRFHMLQNTWSTLRHARELPFIKRVGNILNVNKEFLITLHQINRRFS
jgi:hypothetical protein